MGANPIPATKGVTNMADEPKEPTVTEILNMLHDQIQATERKLTYCDIKFSYEGKYSFYRMNMN